MFFVRLKRKTLKQRLPVNISECKDNKRSVKSWCNHLANTWLLEMFD